MSFHHIKKMRMLKIMSVAMFYLITLGNASKCDRNIIKQIKERFWNNGNCTPKDLLRTGVFQNPAPALRTTEGVYQDQEDVCCAYAIFEGSSSTLYTQYSNGTLNSVTFQHTEKDGYLYEAATATYRYYLYADRYGISVVYKCTKRGKKGAPGAVIKASGRGYEDQALQEAVADLASLGIAVSSKVYNDSCAPQTAS